MQGKKLINDIPYMPILFSTDAFGHWISLLQTVTGLRCNALMVDGSET